MVFWGKVTGAVLGLVSGRPWFVFLGILLGHQFDRGYAAHINKMTGQPGRLPGGFSRILFQLMGWLAKADGRVSEAEIRAARRVMHQLRLRPAQISEAVAWFSEGKQQDFAIEAALQEANRRVRGSERRGLMLRLLLEVSLSKEHVDRRERVQLWKICQSLGIGRVQFAQLEAMIRAQRRFSQSPRGAADGQRLSSAYAVLGVAKNASNGEITKAYRRMTNRHHPDKLAASDPDQETLDEAARKTREVREAYDFLKLRRGFR